MTMKRPATKMTNIQMTNDKNNRMTNIQNPNVKTEKKYFLFLSFEHLKFDIRYLTFVIRSGQSAAEYALFIAAVTAALLCMQLYLYRAYSGNVRRQSQSLSPVPFSPALSNYTKVRETAPYNMTQNKSFQGHMNGEVVRIEGAGQAMRSGGGTLANTSVGSTAVTGIQGQLRSAGISATTFPGYKDFTDKMGDLPSDFSVSGRGALVDDFSGKNMTDDKMELK